MQVMRSSSHIYRDQRPEVHYGQSVGVNRAFCLFGYKVIHDAEKAHGIVAIPPLDHRIDATCIDRIGFCRSDGNRQAVEYMQYRDSDNK